MNTGWIQNINVSSQLTRKCQQQKTGKGVTLYEVKHKKSIDIVPVLYCLRLNFKLLPFASDYVATLNLLFVAGLTVLT